LSFLYHYILILSSLQLALTTEEVANAVKLMIDRVGSCTPGTTGHRLQPNKSGYDLVLSSGKCWETKYSIPDMVPPLLPKMGDHQPKKN
jgi:hypothetical protein